MSSQKFTIHESKPAADKLNQMSIAKYSTTERDALSGAQKFVGMVIWNTTATENQWWDGSSWLRFPRLLGVGNSLTGSFSLTGSLTAYSAEDFRGGQGNVSNRLFMADVSASTAETTLASTSHTVSVRTASLAAAWIINLEAGPEEFTLRLKRGSTVLASVAFTVGADSGASNVVGDDEAAPAGTHTYTSTIDPTNTVTYRYLGAVIAQSVDDDHACSDTHACAADTHACA